MNETVQRLVADYCRAIEAKNIPLDYEIFWSLVRLGDAAVEPLVAILLTNEKPMEEFTSIDWVKRECATYALIYIRTPRAIQEVLKAVELYYDWSDIDWDAALCLVSPYAFSLDLFAAALDAYTNWEAKIFVIGAIDHGINLYKHPASERALKSLIQRLEDASQDQAYAIRMHALHTLKRYFLWSNDAAILGMIKGQVSDPIIGEEAKNCIREIEKAKKTKKSG